MSRTPGKITLAMTGASGMIYGMRLLACLAKQEVSVNLIVSDAAFEVIRLETDYQWPKDLKELHQHLVSTYDFPAERLTIYSKMDWTAPVASGSALVDAMVICPCSSGSVSAIAHGASNNLIERAADVMLKERRPLIIVHRETPLSLIHLQNLTKLAGMGVHIMPASPGFYHRPSNIDELVDFLVARILDQLNMEHQLVPRWGAQ